VEAPFLIWSESFAVGHKGLDAEHRDLVRTINEIHCAENARPPQALIRLSNALMLATIKHFQHENAVMCLEISGAAVSDTVNEHRAEHALVLNRLESIIRNPYFLHTPHELSKNLKDWFLEHALTSDAQLKWLFEINRVPGRLPGQELVADIP
jgi:hemerythrin-like metal-binding protein